MSFQDLEAGRRPPARRELANGKGGDATQAVAAGVFQISTAVSTFQRLVNTLGTPKDTPELREKMQPKKLQMPSLLEIFKQFLKSSKRLSGLLLRGRLSIFHLYLRLFFRPAIRQVKSTFTLIKAPKNVLFLLNLEGRKSYNLIMRSSLMKP